MKIRKGHVSNSSSSSFIVIFDKDPRDEKYLKEAIFSNKESVIYEYGEESISVDSLVHYLKGSFGDHPSVMELVKIVTGGWSTVPGFNEERPEGIESYRNGEMAKYDKLHEEAAKKYILEWIGDANIEHVFTCELADEDGKVGSHLEHGDTFSNFKHIRISNH